MARDDIRIEFADSADLRPDVEFSGTVTVGFPGRYDGVVINVQVLDSNELITFRSHNGKNISSRTGRLFVGREAMPQNSVEFTAVFEFVPQADLEVKFRASIIEQHKEVDSAVVFARLLAP